MRAEDLKGLSVTASVDARFSACPGPLLEAKKAMATISPDDVLEILAVAEGTRTGIPKWCEKQGHEYLGAIEEEGYFKLYLRKR